MEGDEVRLASAFPSFPAPAASVGILTRSDHRFLWMCAALYALLYAAFYPPIYTSIDEASTFGMVYVLRHATIYPPDGFFPSLSPIGPHGVVYRFLIGFPAVLSLVSFAGWRAFFLVNPLLHLGAFWCFARILRAANVDPKWAVLYLLYPPFVLFARTLFADTFAASLTTIGLFFLLRRQGAWAAGLCLGLAMTARSGSAMVAGVLALGLLTADWKGHVPFSQARSVRFGLGLLPFVLVNLAYNFYTMGSPFKSTYNPGDLSLHGLIHSGKLYGLSLLLVYPGMLLALFCFRGRFWRQGLAAGVLLTLIASAYDQSTYGNSFAQTLLATPRQVLPVLPFFLLAYCVVLARAVPQAWTVRAFVPAAIALFLVAVLLSFQHQKYLRQLVAMQQETVHFLPPGAIVYASKDVFKLHQPQWDTHTFRELPYVPDAQAQADLSAHPVFAALFMRSRGFGDEDAKNALLRADLLRRFVLQPGPDAAGVTLSRVQGLKAQNLKPGAETNGDSVQ